MNFSIGFFVGGQVLAGILGSAVTLPYGPGRQTWRQLHADHGGLRRRHVRDVGPRAGDGLDGFASAARLAIGALFHVHRDVWRRPGNALHAHPGGPFAIDLPFRPGCGEHPARLDGQAIAQAFHFQTGRQHRGRVWRVAGGHENRGPQRAVEPLGLDSRRRDDCRRAHRVAGVVGGADRLRG